MLAIPALVLAGPQKMMKNHPMPGKRMDICEQLNLTPEQQDQIHDLKVAHQKKMVPLQADLKLARLELEELIRKGDTSKKLDAAIKKVNDLRAKQFDMQVKHRLDVGKILTDEQRAIWQKHHSGCEMGRGPGGHRGGPGKPNMFDGPGTCRN